MLASDASDTPPSRPSSLLTTTTALVGRAAEIEAVHGLLDTNRLVTLTGAGGVGKTRLAMAVAEAKLGAGTPAHVVDLAAVAVAEQVPAAVAAAMELPLDAGDPVRQLAGAIASRAWLLVLDNCEHVAVAVAELVDALLDVPGELRVLATSRQRLMSAGEQAFPVPSLSSAGDEPPARTLFLNRARAVSPGFTLDRDGIAVVDELCARLDGLPLAIELAAARAALLSPVDLLARIDDPLRLLRGDRRGPGDRRGALEAALAWSYDLLEPEEQWFFRKLAVFVGSFDVAAVAAVSGLDEYDVLDLLDTLASKSLLAGAGDQGRYRLLETVRAYARRQLDASGEVAETRAAHAAHYGDAVAIHGAWRMPDCARGLDHVPDWGNITAAFDWYAHREEWSNAAAVLSGCLSLVIDHGFAGDALRMLDRCLAQADRIDAATLEHVRVVGFTAAIPTNDWSRHEAMVEELAEATDPTIRAIASAERALVNFVVQPDAAIDHIERALAIIDQHDTFPEAAVLALSWSGIADMLTGDLDGALGRLSEALARDLDVGHPTTFRAFARDLLGECLILMGQPDAAVAVLSGPPVPTVWDRSHLLRAVAHADLGDLDRAAESILEWAATTTGGRVASESNDALLALAAIALAEGDSRRALKLLTAAGVPRHIILFPLGYGLGRRIGAEDVVRGHYLAMSVSGIAALGTADDVVRAELDRLRARGEQASARASDLASFLTARERQVLALVGQGLANKQIARRLGLSEKTVRNHLSSVFVKLGVGDRTQAALYAVAHGLAVEIQDRPALPSTGSG